MMNNKEVNSPFIIRGQTLSFHGDPFSQDIEQSYQHLSDGAVLVENSQIKAVGQANILIDENPELPVTHYHDALIMAGFVDSHVHYPQLDIIGAHNSGLLDWLETHTFPKELAFEDGTYAVKIAEYFLDDCFSYGTTTAGVYCTSHMQSVDAFLETASRRGACMVAGKVCMDRHGPIALMDTAQKAYDDSKTLIERWHEKDRLHYAITPRFALTSSPEQLEALGGLWGEFPSVGMQTHLSETHEEIQKVKEYFPSYQDYFAVYEAFGLVGAGAVFGHCIHLTPRELDALVASGSAIAHCPTSNMFLGSGVFDLTVLQPSSSECVVSLGSDVGAGTSLSMLATMRGSYEAMRLHGAILHPLQAFWLATVGGAQALRLGDKIGNLAVGMDADMVILDLKSTNPLRRRTEQATSLADILLAHIIMADDRAIKATYIGGQCVYHKDDEGG